MNGSSLPDGLLLSWYGDDFTGSAASLEVLAFAGVPSALFLAPPTQKQLAYFGQLSAIGVAGAARSQSPAWMEENLPAAYAFMADAGAPISHYKICSTMDSSPSIGSIGRAIDIAQKTFHSRCVLLMPAAPDLERYQAFGHLFAAAGDEVFRIDRHPVMASHPVTPIDEADVCRHVGRQTQRTFGLIDHRALTSDTAAGQALSAQIAAGAEIIAVDAMTQDDLRTIGRLIWRNRDRNRFVVGSQGIQYALVAHWRELGWLPKAQPSASRGAVDLMPVVSGSVSQTTRRQIDWAMDNGFTGVTFDAAAVAAGDQALANAVDTAVSSALSVASAGGNPLIYTARGPQDPGFGVARQAFERAGIDLNAASGKLGEALGQVLSRILDRTGATRAVISGGDTSSHAAQHLGIFALTAAAPTVPGAALLDAHTEHDSKQLEIALKGGQMGTPDYFGWIREGGGIAGRKTI